MKQIIGLAWVGLIVLVAASPASAQERAPKQHRALPGKQISRMPTDKLAHVPLSFEVPLRKIGDPDIVPFDVVLGGQGFAKKVVFRIVETPARSSDFVDENYRKNGSFVDFQVNAQELHEFITKILNGDPVNVHGDVRRLIRAKVTSKLEDKGKSRVLTITVQPEPEDVQAKKASFRIRNLIVPFTTYDSEEVEPYHLGIGSIVIQEDRRREGYVHLNGYDDYDFQKR